MKKVMDSAVRTALLESFTRIETLERQVWSLNQRCKVMRTQLRDLTDQKKNGKSSDFSP